MTTMRERMNDDIHARISLGGKLAGFFGPLPGVVEECLLALESDPPLPLYPIAAFGGATRLVVDGLRAVAREEFTSRKAEENDPSLPAVRELYEANGVPLRTPEQVGERLRELGRGGLASALHNGLDDDENERLVTTSDSYQIVELILEGLSRL